ncbi:MAG TPA: hypothetical protein VD886_25970 [Herpetosiphonaceae bacterium]|nr:hypothetical protein [Herpetosiphonaceae bacterium]
MEREAVIRALGAIGDRSVVPQLIPVLRDPDPGLTHETGLTIERLAHRDFPHDDGHNWQNEAGHAVIAVAVLAWWDAEGRAMDWDHP